MQGNVSWLRHPEGRGVEGVGRRVEEAEMGGGGAVALSLILEHSRAHQN